MDLAFIKCLFRFAGFRQLCITIFVGACSLILALWSSNDKMDLKKLYTFNNIGSCVHTNYIWDNFIIILFSFWVLCSYKTNVCLTCTIINLLSWLPLVRQILLSSSSLVVQRLLLETIVLMCLVIQYGIILLKGWKEWRES